ncbi:hypothetical protein ACIRU3_39235 [Streptomyces sp. NPDC101151]|uniref:hypothetical protein n=1 Tax=Streptomyces sp. NPDC101151 TaxID=3366115 RepID=UPI00382827BC
MTVGDFEPGSAVVDGAVHDRLRAGDLPERTSGALQPDQLDDGSVVGLRPVPGGDPQPQGQRVP